LWCAQYCDEGNTEPQNAFTNLRKEEKGAIKAEEKPSTKYVMGGHLHDKVAL
jgi:hypothetical protein